MKMTNQQVAEVKAILDKFNVGQYERDKIMDFLNSDSALVEIEYDTNYRLKKSLKTLEPALNELKNKGYNIKFEVKGLLVKILYQYQVNDVQVFQPLEGQELPKYYTDSAHTVDRRVKLGNLILQRILMKMSKDHPVITKMGSDSFVKTVNDILLRPLAGLTSSDKQYERIVKNALKKVFGSTTVYEFKAICNATVNSAEEDMKNRIFNNILVSVNTELSEQFSKFTDTEKDNIMWKLRNTLSFIYMSDKDNFIKIFEKIVEQLKSSKSYDEMLSILNNIDKSIQKNK
ncbi:hypothetical protein J7J90_04055 [Candidatus Micrarchaeota archaeon]|nr:hypothetical protein [Candidatus Micrarchaeota archaeon]